MAPAPLLRVADGLLVVAVVGSVLAIGTVHVPVLLAVASLTLVAATLVLLTGFGAERFPTLVVVGMCGAGFTMLQAVPLPAGLLGFVAPPNADVWARALLPLGESAPAFSPVSLDPGATWVEALKGFTYCATFLAAASFGSRRGVERGALLVLASAWILALCAIGHGLTNATRVFGFYTPRFGGTGWGLAPLINHNSRAGYLNLGALCGLGLLTAARPLVPRWLIALGVASIIGVSVNTGSRGGLATLVVGLVVALVLIRRARTEEPAPSGSDRFAIVAAVGTALVVGAAFAFAASTRFTGRLLSDSNLEKLKLPRYVAPLLRDHPWLGIGRGAFESVFPAYRTGTDNLVYVSPENIVLQWTAEWGIPIGVAGLLACGVLLAPRRWGVRTSPIACGMFAGFFTLVLQNLVDLSLELPSVAIAAATVAGIAWGHADGSPSPAAAVRIPARARFLVPVGGALALALAAALGLHTLTRDRDAVRSAFPADPGDRAAAQAFRALLRGAMSRHPADPYFPREGALLAVTSGAENPMPWLQRALERAVTSGRSNYLLATFLASRGYPSQALLQIKLAVAQDPNLAVAASRLVDRLAKNDDDVWKSVPEGRAGVPMLRVLSKALAGTREDLSTRLLEEAVSRDPADDQGRIALAERLLAAMEKGDTAGLCAGAARDSCRRRAAEHIAAVDAVPKRKEDGLVLRARFLRADGRSGEALRLLGERCPAIQPRAKCLHAWLVTATHAQNRDEVTRAARTLERDGCLDRTSCATALSDIADALRPYDAVLALDYYVRAAREDGARARWVRAAREARALGLRGEAVRALTQAKEQGKDDPELRRLLDQAAQGD